MAKALKLLIVLSLVPLASIFTPDGSQIRLATVLASGLAILQMMASRDGRMAAPGGTADVVRYSVLFTAFAAASLALSPYSEKIWSSFVVQIGGLWIAVLSAIWVARAVQNPRIVPAAILRTMMTVSGIIAALGIAQWVAANIVGALGITSFAWANEALDGIVWRDPGQAGPWARVNSVAAEPAHFARLLAPALGLISVKLSGGWGWDSEPMKRVAPAWSVGAVLISLLLAGSLIGYTLLATIVLTSVLIRGKPAGRTRPRTLILISASTITILAVLNQPDIRSKALTIPEALLPIADSGYDADSISALTISANRFVAFESLRRAPFLGMGLASHPLAYNDFLPTYIARNPYVLDLNTQDAGSLLLRLLSESGAFGALTYTLALASVLFRGAKAARVAIASADRQARDLGRLLIGLTTAGIALLVIDYFRYPAYYDPLRWLVIGITAGLSSRVSTISVHARAPTSAPQAEGTLRQHPVSKSRGGQL